MEDSREPILAIAGPTASGKSGLALDVAEQLGAEIVNADAFQLYRGMDIGTAKVPPGERRGIPHHQLDVLDITQDATVAAYQREARADLAAIRRRGKVAILVGGSGLYVRAALDDLDIPPTDLAVRQRLETEAQERGLDAVRERLRSLDPVSYERIEANNSRRIVRALEVIELTGRPFSATLPTGRFVAPTVLVALRVPRAQLDARIELRTRAMWAAGFLDEVATLAAQGLAATRTASRAVGYPQALAQLAGECTQEEAIAATAAATRRLVRRQESWWRGDHRVVWLDAPDGTSPHELAGRTLAAMR